MATRPGSGPDVVHLPAAFDHDRPLRLRRDLSVTRESGVPRVTPVRSELRTPKRPHSKASGGPAAWECGGLPPLSRAGAGSGGIDSEARIRRTTDRWPRP